jgi:DNA-binding NtrC family response regulator
MLPRSPPHTVNTSTALESAQKLTLVIVDDEPASMRALCDTLEYEGYRTYGYTSAADALAAMRERSFDLLLADLQMPGTNGIDLIKSAQLIDPTLVAIIMTGHGALDTAVAAMKAGALDYIQKPIKLATTLPVVERALAVRQLRI